MMMTVICYDHETKNQRTGDIVMTVSFSAHISNDAREKLKAYQDVYEFKNASDALEHLIKHTKVPEPKKRPTEPDPNQSILPGCEP